jgi:hypothetical protein
MSSPGPSDDSAIETALREMLAPLDRRLGTVATTAGLALIFGCPGVGLVLWLGTDWVWTSLLVAFGVFCCVVAAGMYAEHHLGRWALRQFDTRFPPDSPHREQAIRILGEMESPNKAERKLLEYLEQGTPGGGIIRRRPGPSPEQVIDATLHPGTPAPPPPATPPVAQEPAPGAKKPGGYYDYIPLELPPSPHPDDKK